MRGTHTQTHLAFIGADKAHSQTAGSPTATITLTKHLSKHISKHLEIVCLTVSLCVFLLLSRSMSVCGSAES